MGERPTDMPTINEVRWDPTAGNQTEPTEGKKDVGWPLNSLVPFKELNWHWFKEWKFLDWLRQVAIREFSTLEGGITVLSSPDTFRVHAPAAGLSARAEPIFNRQGSATTVAIIDVAGDGERIYYAQAGATYAAKPADGTDHGDWSTNPYNPATAGDVQCLAADGRYVYIVYVYSATGGDHEIHTLDPADGTLLSSQDQQGVTSYNKCRANGGSFVALTGNTILIYTVGAVGVLTYDGSYNHGAALAALGIDDQYAYIGGTQGSGNFDVRKIRLSTQTATWSVALPVTSAPTINAIWTDGDLIYVATDEVTTTAPYGSVSASVFALNPMIGTLVWHSFPGDTNELAGDDRWLYCTGSDLATRVLDKWSGQYIWTAPDSVTLLADGISLIATDGQYDLRRVYRGDPTKLFQRVVGTDIHRRPFFNLAIPLGQGSGQ